MLSTQKLLQLQSTSQINHIPYLILLYSTLMGPKGVSDAKKKKKPITASQAAQVRLIFN